MYSNNKYIAIRINEIATSIAKSDAINGFNLINEIYKEEIKTKKETQSSKKRSRKTKKKELGG